jgi:hypothetical protein
MRKWPERLEFQQPRLVSALLAGLGFNRSPGPLWTRKKSWQRHARKDRGDEARAGKYKAQPDCRLCKLDGMPLLAGIKKAAEKRPFDWGRKPFI